MTIKYDIILIVDIKGLGIIINIRQIIFKIFIIDRVVFQAFAALDCEILSIVFKFFTYMEYFS